MKNPNEILWEFTLKCNKNCSYCGSKNILNSNERKFTYEEITKAIISVHPKEVTITGGEPSVKFDELYKSVNALTYAKINVKVLSNGHIFEKITDDFNKMISQYGLSVNTLDDIEQLKKDGKFLKYLNKTTMITNFGTHNIENIFEIAKFAVQFSCWQVQLTIGNEFQLDLNQIRDLQDKLEKLKESKLINLIKADNFNCGKCMAGIYGFSITYDGNIIPCLSYRAWKSDLCIQGTIKDIKNIWQNGFKFNRERKFVPSCKSISGIEKVGDNEIQTVDPYGDVLRTLKIQKEKQKKDSETVFMYGVNIPPKKSDRTDKFPDYTVVYGVSMPNDDNFKDHITVYSVASPNNIDDVRLVYGVSYPSNNSWNNDITVENKEITDEDLKNSENI